MIKKEKAIGGVIWSFVDSIANQGVQFIVGVVLANILSPYEFGLIGILTIFIAVSQSFIDSGFSIALIRKRNCTQEDYSTIFFFNITIACLLYLVLYVLSGPISVFFRIEELMLLTQVLALSLIINSFSIIQRTILIKGIQFKEQAKVSVISSVISGVVAIYMAYVGYGVWSLVALTLLRFGLSGIFFWVWSKWRPKFVFSISSFKELFSFGSKILFSGLIDTIYQNVYFLIIGKYFSAIDLGYFTRASQFQELPSKNLQGIISRVSFPVLSLIQDDKKKLKDASKKLTKSTMLVTFVLMMGLVAIAKPLILVLIGEKWIAVVGYLQLLCFTGMFYPLQSLNLNILNVLGRSDLYLLLEVIKKTLAIPIIAIGIMFGIETMILGMIIGSLISYYINSYWTGKLINYAFVEQVKDVVPSLLIAIFVNSIVLVAGIYLPFSPLYILFIQIILGAVLTMVVCEIFQLKEYLFIKKNIIKRMINESTKK